MYSEAKKRRYKLRGNLIAAANKLGVSYGHLYMVVSGKRESVSLLNRYLKITEKDEPLKPIPTNDKKYENTSPNS